jgi:hypothetical protein
MKRWKLLLISLVLGYTGFTLASILSELYRDGIALGGYMSTYGIVNYSLLGALSALLMLFAVIGLVFVLFVEKLPHISIAVRKNKLEEEK